MKVCKKCGIEKDESEFYKSGKIRKDGSKAIRSICKSCTNKQSSDWSKQNVEKRREIGRNFYSRNSKDICEKKREYLKNRTDEEKKRDREYSREYSQKNKEILRAKRKEVYDPSKQSKKWKEYYEKNREKLLEKKKIQRSNLSEEQKQNVRDQNRLWRIKNPEKERAHKIVEYAIQKGEIIKPEVCENCGKKLRLDAHHEDYSKPLEIQWFCRFCHVQHHKKD